MSANFVAFLHLSDGNMNYSRGPDNTTVTALSNQTYSVAIKDEVAALKKDVSKLQVDMSGVKQDPSPDYELIPSHEITKEYIEDRYGKHMLRLSCYRSSLATASCDDVGELVMKSWAIVERFWQTLCHQVTGRRENRYAHGSGQFPMQAQGEAAWKFPQDEGVVNNGLKMAMEAFVSEMRPKLRGERNETEYANMTSFWLMTLSEIRDIVAHRDTITVLSLPHHGHSMFPVEKISKVFTMDTYSHVRTGENILIRVDAQAACLSMIAAVETVLTEMMTMAVEHQQ